MDPNLVAKTLKIACVLLLPLAACESSDNSTYEKIEKNYRILESISDPVAHLSSASYCVDEYNKIKFLNSGSTRREYDILCSIQNILVSGSSTEDVSYDSNTIERLLEYREVLVKILERPEDIQKITEVFSQEEDRTGKSLDIRLSKIIPLSGNQYILYFLNSFGLYSGIGLHFLFSIENGINEEPLYLSLVEHDSPTQNLEISRIENDTPFIGGTPLLNEEPSEYFYFMSGSTRNQYWEFRYSLQNERLVLEEQIVGVRSVSNDLYLINRFIRQGNIWKVIPAQECSSSIHLWPPLEQLNKC